MSSELSFFEDIPLAAALAKVLGHLEFLESLLLNRICKMTRVENFWRLQGVAKVLEQLVFLKGQLALNPLCTMNMELSFEKLWQPMLEVLDVRDNEIDPDGMRELAPALVGMLLQELIFAQNDLASEGVSCSE